jgi:hypothetical protein
MTVPPLPKDYLIPISNKKTTDLGEPEWMEPLSVENYPLSLSKASVASSKQIGMSNHSQIYLSGLFHVWENYQTKKNLENHEV